MFDDGACCAHKEPSTTELEIMEEKEMRRQVYCFMSELHHQISPCFSPGEGDPDATNISSGQTPTTWHLLRIGHSVATPHSKGLRHLKNQILV